MAEVSAFGIADAINAAINDNLIPDLPDSIGMPDEPEGDDNEATVRISWGGADLFDLTVKRI